MNNMILQLQNLFLINRLPHAFILTGRQIDLHMEAFAFARRVFCQAPKQNLACGDCKICKLLAANTLPDFMHIQAETAGNSKVIKIEQIRELIKFAQVQPQFCQKKIALIDAAENLNVQAANALLRTLEEPPPNVHIILTVENAKLLIDTLLSRCPIFNLTTAEEAGTEIALLNTILLDLYSIFILKEVHLVTIIEKWHKLEAMQLVTCLWLLVVELVQYSFNSSCNYKSLDAKKLAQLNALQSLPQLWPILDKVLELRRYLILGLQINVQLYLENLLLGWQEELKNDKR